MQESLRFEREDHAPQDPPLPVPALYVFHAEGTRMIKIGYATDVEQRRREVQVGCPYPLRLLCAFAHVQAARIEQRLHTLFASSRIQGEWFLLPDDVPATLAVLARIMQERGSRDRGLRQQAVSFQSSPLRERHEITAEQLSQWLGPARSTTWREIAQTHLGLPREGWNNRSLQMHVAQLLRAMGWTAKIERRGNEVRRVWRRLESA
jgi:Meiotically up-regulated gene 113